MREVRHREMKQLASIETRPVLGIIPFWGDFADWQVEMLTLFHNACKPGRERKIFGLPDVPSGITGSSRVRSLRWKCCYSHVFSAKPGISEGDGQTMPCFRQADPTATLRPLYVLRNI